MNLFSLIVLLEIGIGVVVLEKSYKRPVCSSVDSSSCLSYDSDPDPIPWLIHPPSSPPSQLPTGSDDPLLDIVAKDVNIPRHEQGAFHIRTPKLERYFVQGDIGGVKDEFEGTGLDVIEWPGMFSKIKRSVTRRRRRKKRNGGDLKQDPMDSYQGRLEKRLNANFIPLKFVGDKSVFDSYVCNRRLGTHIQVMVLRLNEEYQDEDVGIYLTFGSRSFHREYIHPLFVPLTELNILAENHKDPKCQKQMINEDEHDFDDNSELNKVYSIAFSTNRLLFGTGCGILFLKPLDSDVNWIEAAKRIPDPNDLNNWFDDDGMGNIKIEPKPRFPGPITRITSNICCYNCQDNKPIAVAYNYKGIQSSSELKVIYVSHDNGESWDQKVVSVDPGTYLKLIYQLYNLMNFTVPEEIKNRIVKRKSDLLWGNDTDIAVDYIMSGGNTITNGSGAQPIPGQEVKCVEIVSIQASAEREGFFGLCRTKLEDHPEDPVHYKIGHYAVYEFTISKYSPLIHGIRLSERRKSCNIYGETVNDMSEPDIVLGRRSLDMILRGCETIIYHSINGGVTFTNSIFFTKAADGTYQRSNRIADLHYTMLAMDPNGISMAFTFGDFYAIGLATYTKELTIVVGQITETVGKKEDVGVCSILNENPCTICKNKALVPPDCLLVEEKCLVPDTVDPSCTSYTDHKIKYRSQRRFLPYYTNSGDIKLATSVMHFLKQRNPKDPYVELNEHYKNREAIRLIDIPFSYTAALRPFFQENEYLTDKTKSARPCRTFAFNLTLLNSDDDRTLYLDSGSIGELIVSVESKNHDILLGMFASVSNMLKIDVERNDKLGDGSLNDQEIHEWNIKVQPLRVPKDNLSLSEDSFFGSSYDLFTQKSTNLILANPPSRRCHTQNTGEVLLSIGCSGTSIVAHEDYNRPHCDKYFGSVSDDSEERIYKPYTFTLEDGEYDPELLSYWKNSKPELFQRKENSWIVAYDYATFGCPIKPFYLNNFKPDLRIMDKNKNNMSDTKAGMDFHGEYILIEIFGQSGFSYTQSVREAGCKRPPLTLKRMKEEWKERRKVIFNGYNIYKSFHPLEVAKPYNIWQKSMHRSCFTPNRPAEEVTDLLVPYDEPYEIMKRISNNSLTFDRKTRKDLYFFLAIDIDQDIETFCDYYTFFAVAIENEPRSTPWFSILRFLLLILFLLLIIWIGYYLYGYLKSRSYRDTAFFQRLERGAWEILLRYEKYLNEVEIQGNDRIRMINNQPTLFLQEPKGNKNQQVDKSKLQKFKKRKLSTQ